MAWGFLALKGFFELVCSVGVGRDGICARRELACDFGSGLAGGRARQGPRPTETALRPWSAGGHAPLALEGTVLT